MKRYGTLEKNIARGLTIRSDRGSQYISKYYRQSMDHLGIEISPTWARSLESNGIVERFHRTIEGQVFKMHDFDTIGEAEEAISNFIERYNREWMIERLGYLSPHEALFVHNAERQKSA